MLKFGGVMADNNYNNLISKKRKSESFSFLSSLKYIVCLGTIFYLFSSSNDLKTKKDCIPYDNTKLILESSDVDDIVLNLEREFGVEIDDQNIDSLVLLNSILENENINNDDKKIFYGFYSIVEDCKYLDKENAYKTFKNLSIERTRHEDNNTSKVLGDYLFNSKKINIYVEKDFDNRIITHEGIHALFTSKKSFKLPYYFREGMTELLSNEYYSDDPFYEANIYPYQVSYIKMLCEMVGSDIVMETFCKGDFSLITNYLDLYNNTNYDSKDLLDIYEDSFKSQLEGTKSKYSSQLQEEARNNLKKIYLNINPDYDNYSSFEYNLNLASSVFEEDAEDFYFDYINYNGIFEKAYFNTDLKNKFSNSRLVNLNEREKVLVKRK